MAVCTRDRAIDTSFMLICSGSFIVFIIKFCSYYSIINSFSLSFVEFIKVGLQFSRLFTPIKIRSLSQRWHDYLEETFYEET